MRKLLIALLVVLTLTSIVEARGRGTRTRTRTRSRSRQVFKKGYKSKSTKEKERKDAKQRRDKTKVSLPDVSWKTSEQNTRWVDKKCGPCKGRGLQVLKIANGDGTYRTETVICPHCSGQGTKGMEMR